MNFALRKKIKIIYFNMQRIELINHDLYEAAKPSVRFFNILPDASRILYLRKVVNPYNISCKMIKHSLQNNLLKEFSLTRKKDVQCLDLVKKNMMRHSTFYKKLFSIDFTDEDA